MKGDFMNKKIIIFNCIMFLAVCIIALAIFLGLKNRPIVVIQQDNIPNDYIGQYELTFYTHTGNNTSTGVYPKINRTVAVDPSIIPYGTVLYVKGHGVFIAEDSGADIKGHRLDIFLDTKEECINKGRVNADVYILGKL